MRARGAYVVIHLSVCRHTTTQSPTAAARTQLIDVRRALEVLGVTQLRRPRPAGFRRSATSRAAQRRSPVSAADPARRAATPARVNRLENIIWRRLNTCSKFSSPTCILPHPT
eukprot:scaffold43127_cov62-Phaeocystis_antarctica.AAC.7